MAEVHLKASSQLMGPTIIGADLIEADLIGAELQNLQNQEQLEAHNESQVESWCQQHLLFCSKSIVIVGLGNGAHIKRFLELAHVKHVTVVDCSEHRAVEFKKNYHEILNHVSLIIKSNITELLKSEFAKTLPEDLPSVLSFQPGFQEDSILLNEFFKTLTGRNREGLEFFLKTFFPEEEGRLEIEEESDLFTIRSLGLMISSQNQTSRLDPALRLLKELVI